MKKNKLIFVLIAIFFVVSIFGCSKNISNQNSEKKVVDTTTKSMTIGLITDLGGINDHSFNQLTFEGLSNLSKENPNILTSYLESKTFSDFNLNIENYINYGCDLIVTVGATFIDTLIEAAKEYPEQNFAIVGVAIDEQLPNVACFTFANEESSYLCGIAAAMSSKTNTIGYVQGTAIDALNLFGIGFIEGAKSINQNIKVLQYNANNFADIAGGNIAANNMIKNNADVIYQAAGATGIGVINACADNKVFAIGCDTDQSFIAPDTVLLSSIQDAGNAIKEYGLDMYNNGFKSGIIESNLKNGNVNICYNDKILPNEIKEKIENTKKDIINGKIKISKNSSDCPDFTLAN